MISQTFKDLHSHCNREKGKESVSDSGTEVVTFRLLISSAWVRKPSSFSPVPILLWSRCSFSSSLRTTCNWASTWKKQNQKRAFSPWHSECMAKNIKLPQREKENAVPSLKESMWHFALNENTGLCSKRLQIQTETDINGDDGEREGFKIAMCFICSLLFTILRNLFQCC